MLQEECNVNVGRTSLFLKNMKTKEVLLQLIPQQGILPLYFHKELDVSVEVMKALYRVGIRAIEYTNRGKEAFENFVKMRKVSNEMDSRMYFGIGTVKDPETARKYIDAGCDFIVSPGLSKTITLEANVQEILWVPGCMTPSEIMLAESLGATVIKIFPGNILGPSFINSIKPLFPNLLFMLTGGVEVENENISEWLKSGACAAGIGSKLISSQLMDKRDYESIEENTKKGLKMFNSFVDANNNR